MTASEVPDQAILISLRSGSKYLKVRTQVTPSHTYVLSYRVDQTTHKVVSRTFTILPGDLPVFLVTKTLSQFFE